MSAKGSRRSAGISLTTTQRAADMSAACHDELPQRDSSAADRTDSSRPPTTSTAHATQVAIPVAANSVAFQRPIHTKPYLEGHKPSSLNCVSFSDREINNSDLREGLINVSQTLAILPTGAPRSWHRAPPQRRAPAVTKARSERRSPRSRARARLCHLSHYSDELRRDWAVMRH